MTGNARSDHSSTPAPVTLPDYQALAAFRRSLRAFLHFSEQAARAEGLTSTQHQLLLAVKGVPTSQLPTIADVAESLKLRHHSAVELVDRAVAAGLVERRADPDDGRRQRVALTPLGERKLASLSALHRHELQRFKQDTIFHLESL
ncbi:MAG: MarR family winged helix-turn-helix transcriptional regulator [Actinomycetota bacterium]|nr:MarR family winged helix-turn-helix transcriptional regulator [Actinomycetota bacterium]